MRTSIWSLAQVFMTLGSLVAAPPILSVGGSRSQTKPSRGLCYCDDCSRILSQDDSAALLAYDWWRS